MRRYALLVVEGFHDLAIVDDRLRRLDFREVRDVTELDAVWQRVAAPVARGWGRVGERPTERRFYGLGEHWSVHLCEAGGLSEVPQRAADVLAALDRTPDAIGLLVDADDQSPRGQAAKVRTKLVKAGLKQEFPAEPGNVRAGPPRTGLFVLPDNASHGTAEALLLAAGKQRFPALHQHTESWINTIYADPSAHLPRKKDRSKLIKPAGASKAQLHAMAQAMRPGSSLAVSIADNAWLDVPATPGIAALDAFLQQLLGGP